MDVKLPNLGEGADSGTVINLFVKAGDVVEKNQPILELENEKAVATIPAGAAGVVTQVFVKNGDKVSVGQRLISLAEPGAAVPPPAPAPQPAAAAPTHPVPALATHSPAPQPGPELPPPAGNGEVIASPSLRKMAADLGIELGRIRGTGTAGRILLADVRQYIQWLIQAAAQPKAAAATSAPAASPAAPVAESIDFSKWGEISRKPLSPLRKVIARRMVENWNTIPHVTQFDNADVTGVMELLKRHAEAFAKQGAKLTLTPFLIQALVATLKQYPALNASLDEATGEIVYKHYHHIGIAVDTEAGLIVPVLRDADKKSLLEITKELEELARKARDRKVSAEELKGGTFTISNQGGIGGMHFTPIVNKPEVAILGLGRAAWQPVVRDGVIEARRLLPLGLSYDHRVIDGGTAARFTVDLVKAIAGLSDASVA